MTPPSGQALYDAAIAAAAARVDKDERLQGAYKGLIEGWRDGALHLYGLDEDTGQFARINPAVAWYSEDEPGQIEIRDGAMFKNPAGAPGYSRRPMFRNVVIRRRTLIDWAATSGTETNTDAGWVPSGEKMMSPSPEGGPSQQTNADPEQVPANAEARIEADAAGRGSTDAPQSAVTPIRTGLAGRPTSRDFILPEARRRLESGDFPDALAAFCREMADWFSTTPEAKAGAPVPTALTVQNLIRSLWQGRDPSKARKTPR